MKRYKISGHILAMLCARDIISRRDCTISSEKKKRLLELIDQCRFESAFFMMLEEPGGEDTMLDYALYSFKEREFVEGINHAKRAAPIWRAICDGLWKIPYETAYLNTNKEIVDLIIEEYKDDISYNDKIVYYKPTKSTLASILEVEMGNNT